MITYKFERTVGPKHVSGFRILVKVKGKIDIALAGVTPHLFITGSGFTFTLDSLSINIEIVVVNSNLESSVGALTYGLDLGPVGEVSVNVDETFYLGLVPLGSAVLGYKANLLYGSIVVDVINAISGSGKVLTIVDNGDCGTGSKFERLNVTFCTAVHAPILVLAELELVCGGEFDVLHNIDVSILGGHEVLVPVGSEKGTDDGPVGITLNRKDLFLCGCNGNCALGLECAHRSGDLGSTCGNCYYLTAIHGSHCGSVGCPGGSGLVGSILRLVGDRELELLAYLKGLGCCVEFNTCKGNLLGLILLLTGHQCNHNRECNGKRFKNSVHLLNFLVINEVKSVYVLVSQTQMYAKNIICQIFAAKNNPRNFRGLIIY